MKALSVVRISILNALMTALLFSGQAIADIPSETYKALGVSKSASPKELYGKLKERYLDPEQGAGKGSLAEYWEPIPMSAYLDPLSFYKPPASVKESNTRDECVSCHEEETAQAEKKIAAQGLRP